MYDLCVVGAGMIGSAAARQASLSDPKVKVALIGPEEPKERQGHTIYGAYYDEARITRGTATDPLWAKLAVDSIARYQDLQQQSGIQFYNEVGNLTVGDAGSAYIKNTERSIGQAKVTPDIYPVSELGRTFPYLLLQPKSIGILEKSDSGYINPRKLVQAEQLLARKNGCTIFNDIVESITESRQRGVTFMTLTTQKGMRIESRKVLLCTGAFTTFRKLLPSGLEPDLDLCTQAVIFAELGPADMRTLRNMPSMLYQSDALSPPQQDNFNLYALPPVKYPDGKNYLKIGHCQQLERSLSTGQEVAQWYSQPVPASMEKALTDLLHTVFPGIHPLSYHTDSCVICNTPNRRPYIDLVTSNLGVAIGGNGCAAKSCDQLGKLGADLILKGEWGYPDFHRESVKCRWKTQAKL